MEVFVIPKSTSFGVLPTWDNVMTPTLMPTYIHYYADQINYTQTHTHTHNTMEYYSAIKKNGILPFTKLWMDLECITFNEMK